MCRSDVSSLTGDDAVQCAIALGLRVVFCGELFLYPCEEFDAGELVRLIYEGHGERLTVEDPTLRAELS